MVIMDNYLMLGAVEPLTVGVRKISSINNSVLLTLNRVGSGGFGIEFSIDGNQVGWLGYEVSDGRLHWNTPGGSHIIAFVE